MKHESFKEYVFHLLKQEHIVMDKKLDIQMMEKISLYVEMAFEHAIKKGENM